MLCLIVTLVLSADFVLCLIVTLGLCAVFVLCLIATLVLRALFVLCLIVTLVLCTVLVLFDCYVSSLRCIGVGLNPLHHPASHLTSPTAGNGFHYFTSRQIKCQKTLKKLPVSKYYSSGYASCSYIFLILTSKETCGKRLCAIPNRLIPHGNISTFTHYSLSQVISGFKIIQCPR